MANKKKTAEDLLIEREELLKQIEELQKKQSKKEDEEESSSTIAELQKENETLRELVENYKKDINNITQFAQQVMLEYGSRKEEPQKQEPNEEESEFDEAEKALDEYLKSKGAQDDKFTNNGISEKNANI